MQRIDEELRQLDLASGALHPFALVAIEGDDLGGAAGVALGSQEPRERTQGGPVVRHQLEHPPVKTDRVVRGAEGLFFEQRPLAQQVELQRGVRALDAQIEQPAQIVAPVGLAEHPVERLDGEIVVLVFLDEQAVRLDGLVRRFGERVLQGGSPAMAAVGPVSKLEAYDVFARRFGSARTLRAAE